MADPAVIVAKYVIDEELFVTPEAAIARRFVLLVIGMRFAKLVMLLPFPFKSLPMVRLVPFP
jgi:hypothetical protein